MSKTGCRHSRYWFIGSNRAWCPDCGALRRLVEDGNGGLRFAWPRWLKPQGMPRTHDALTRMTTGPATAPAALPKP
jgi:hypothetical protein